MSKPSSRVPSSAGRRSPASHSTESAIDAVQAAQEPWSPGQVAPSEFAMPIGAPAKDHEIVELLKVLVLTVVDPDQLNAQLGVSRSRVTGVGMNGVCSANASTLPRPRKEKSRKMVLNEVASSGVIHPEELYTLTALKHRLGIKDATLRQARKAGLQVYYVSKQGYIRGCDWIEYVVNSQGIREGAANA